MSEFTKGKLSIQAGINCLGELTAQSPRGKTWVIARVTGASTGPDAAKANAARLAHCWNHINDYEAALNDISMKVGYITIHGVGKRDTTPGIPKPVAIPFEEVWELIQEIGNAAKAALSKANPK